MLSSIDHILVPACIIAHDFDEILVGETTAKASYILISKFIYTFENKRTTIKCEVVKKSNSGTEEYIYSGTPEECVKLLKEIADREGYEFNPSELTMK